jgi:hypothetical protein
MKNTIQMTGGELAAVHALRQGLPVKMADAVPAVKAAAVPRAGVSSAATTNRAAMPAIPAGVPDPDLSVPERGTTGPVPISDVMEPIRRIIAHPDRNRLMAEFFRRHW